MFHIVFAPYTQNSIFPMQVIYRRFIQVSNRKPEIKETSSRGMTVPSSMTRVLSGKEMCRTRPETVTYSPPAFRSSGTKYSMVASGRSGRWVMSVARRRFSSSASCASSSRLSAVSRAVSPRRLVARQRGKRRELCGSVEHRHLRMVLRDVVRQVNDVIVGGHFTNSFAKHQ